MQLAASLALLGTVSACTWSHANPRPPDAPLSPTPVGTSAPSTGATEAVFNYYANPRYGFSLDVPASFHQGQPPENGDGEEFDSPDGATTLSAYGSNNVMNDTPAAVAAKLVAYLTAANGSVTYKSVAGRVVVVSGTYEKSGADRVMYARTVVGAGSEDTVWWDYPASAKAIDDPLVAHSVRSMQAGDVSANH